MIIIQMVTQYLAVQKSVYTIVIEPAIELLLARVHMRQVVYSDLAGTRVSGGGRPEATLRLEATDPTSVAKPRKITSNPVVKSSFTQ